MSTERKYFPANTALVRLQAIAASRDGATQQLLTRLGSVVIIAPHPDDETLGCGGLIAACADLGITTTIVSVTNGEGSHPGSQQWGKQQLAQLRCEEQYRALQVLGLDSPSMVRMNLPDGEVAEQPSSAVSDAQSKLLRLCRRLSPCSVFVTASDDDHPDHRASAQLLLEVEKYVTGLQVFHYAVWPSASASNDSDGSNNGRLHRQQWQLDIRPALQRKADAIACHRSQRGLVVSDDPDGFCMPENLLERALATHEIFEKNLSTANPCI